jgi:hypothetical protein
VSRAHCYRPAVPLNWLFGPGTRRVNGIRSLRSQTLFIEAVRDVYAFADQHHQQFLFTPNGASEEDLRAVREYPPLIRVHPANPFAPSMSQPRNVTVDELEELSAFDRDRLDIYGRRAMVDFRRGLPPTVWAADQIEQDALISYLAGVGVPRVPWKRALFIPLVLAAIGLTVLWLVTELQGHASPASFAFTGVITAVADGVLLFASVRTYQRFKYWYPGHRIRPYTQAAYRDRRANVRVNIQVGLVTGLAGVVVGAVLTAVLKP